MEAKIKKTMVRGKYPPSPYPFLCLQLSLFPYFSFYLSLISLYILSPLFVPLLIHFSSSVPLSHPLLFLLPFFISFSDFLSLLSLILVSMWLCIGWSLPLPVSFSPSLPPGSVPISLLPSSCLHLSEPYSLPFPPSCFPALLPPSLLSLSLPSLPPSRGLTVLFSFLHGGGGVGAAAYRAAVCWAASLSFRGAAAETPAGIFIRSVRGDVAVFWGFRVPFFLSSSRAALSDPFNSNGRRQGGD